MRPIVVIVLYAERPAGLLPFPHRTIQVPSSNAYDTFWRLA